MFNSGTKRRIIDWLRFHSVGVLLSLAICLIVSLPPVIFHFSPHFAGVEMLKTNTEEHYVSEIQEVYDGHPDLGNPYLADLKDAPYVFPPFSPNLIAGIGKLFQLNAVSAVIVLRFVFSFATAFTLYLLALAITRRRIIAIVAPAVIMLAYNLLDPGVWIRLLHGYTDFSRVGFNGYGRPVNPEISFLIFTLYLLCLWRFIEEKRRTAYGVTAAILLGISFYAYFYTWTFIYSLNGFLCLVFAAKREWKKVKQVVAISFGGAVVGIPYFFHIRTVMAHPWYVESTARVGFVPSRELNLSRVIFTALVVFFLSRKVFSTAQRRFWFAFFLTAIFVVNEQVITGRYVFNHHFHWYYNTPLALLFLVSCVILVAEKLPRQRTVVRILAIAMLLVAFTNGILRQRAAYIAALPQVIDEQRYAPVFVWLNTQTQKDSVVLGNYAVYNLVNAVTHNNAYASPSAMVTLAPNVRFMDNYIVYTYLDVGPSTTIVSYFEGRRKDISNSVFDYQYRFTQGKCLECFPDEVIDYMANTYQGLSDVNFLAYVRKYPIDYLVWDTTKDPQWRIDRFGLPVATTIGEFKIYEL